MVQFMKKSKAAGGIVINSEGKVLLVEQLGHSWSFPKGRIESGETPLETAKREIYEESGITDLKLIEDLGSYQRYQITDDGKSEDKSVLKTIFLFLFITTQEKIKPIDTNNPQAIWLKKEDVCNQLTHNKDKEFFQSIIEKI